MTALDEARGIALHADAVRRALGDEANDAAWASERDRIAAHDLPRLNALLASVGREPVLDRPGGHPPGRALTLVATMLAATKPDDGDPRGKAA